MWDRQHDSSDANQSSMSVATSYSSSNNQQQSMLSPRNVMKFISKNIEEIGSPRLSMFFGERNSNGTPTYAAISQAEIHKIFGQYLTSIDTEISKYKIHSSRKFDSESQPESQNQKGQRKQQGKKQNKNKNKNKNKQKDKEQIQAEVLLSRIPGQYFQNWEAQQQALSKQTQQIKIENEEILGKKFTEKKSHKLQILLIDQQEAMDGKLSQIQKRKKRPSLRQKQQEIQEFLDSIQFLIFRKTRKYPDKYLYYLMNFKAADQEVTKVLSNLKQCRQTMQQKIIKTHKKHIKIVNNIRKKEKIKEMLKILQMIKSIHEFKKQSVEQIALFKNEKIQTDKQKTMSLFQKIQQIKEQKSNIQLQKIRSISEILKNVQILHTQNKEKKLKQFCKQVQTYLNTHLSSIYSRDQWLKGQLPSDALMKNQIGIPQEAEEGAMNNSYMNISILDQSYCMTAKVSLSQKVMKTNRSEKLQKQLSNFWMSYLREHQSENLQQQEQQIAEIMMRSFLKFHISFQKDLEEYICYIYTHNSLPIQTPTYTNHKQRLKFIQPKFYNKIIKVYFSGLSLIFSFAIKLSKLQSTKQKVLKQVIQKISQFIALRPVDENTQYQDVSVLVSVLDFWSEQIAVLQNNFSNKCLDNDDEELSKEAMVLELEEHINKCRNKMVEEYLNSLHQHAVVFQLKMAIERSSFSPVSVPLNSFSILDFILNWGQEREIKPTEGDGQRMDESMNVSFSMLKQLQNENGEQPLKKNKASFSIFKIIDKVLIIQGTQYKICDSFIPFCHYLGAYLHSKFQNPDLLQKIDEKICELIGFYIWYNKKVLFGVSTIGGQKKTIRNLCMATNICNLLLKILDILGIKSNQKKVDKVLNDIVMIKGEIDKEIGMVPFYLIEKQISILYESRLKSRKQVPTKQTTKIVQILQASRKALEEYYPDYRHQQGQVKIYLSNCVKMVTKNYFGYLFNMEGRGKAELKWFLPGFKQSVGDLFSVQLQNMQKNLRF